MSQRIVIIMVSTKVIAVAIIAIVAVAGVAALVLLGGQGGGNNNSVDTALAVYGNANNDNTIDQKDIDIINDIIAEKKELKDYPFADANNDSKVNEADVDVVKAIMNKSTTTVLIQCLDPSGNATAKDVAYPLKNFAVIGTNMVPVAINAGAVSSSVAWYEGSTAYPNLEKEMKDKAFSLGKSGRGAISDALWKNFTDRDAELRTSTGTGIQAFFVDHSLGSAITSKIREDLAAIGIPEIRLAVADPYKDISSTMMIGFLVGGDAEKTAKNYSDKSIAVLNAIEKKVSGIKDADKKTYIGITMSNYICQNESTFGQLGAYVAGIPYYQANSEFAELYKGTSSTVMSSFEALSNFAIKEKLGDKAGIDVIFSNRSVDFKMGEENRGATVIAEWEKSVSGGAKGKAMDYFKDLDCYEQLYYINNLLPGACKLAYAAACLYPGQYSMSDADNVVKDFAKFCITLKDVDNKNSALCFGYADYSEAKKAAA